MKVKVIKVRKTGFFVSGVTHDLEGNPINVTTTNREVDALHFSSENNDAENVIGGVLTIPFSDFNGAEFFEVFEVEI